MVVSKPLEQGQPYSRGAINPLMLVPILFEIAGDCQVLFSRSREEPWLAVLPPGLPALRCEVTTAQETDVGFIDICE